MAIITVVLSANIRLMEKAINEYFCARSDYIRITSSVIINPHQDGTSVLSFTESNEADTDISGIQAALLRELAKIEGIQSVGNIHVRPLLKQRNNPKKNLQPVWIQNDNPSREELSILGLHQLSQMPPRRRLLMTL